MVFKVIDIQIFADALIGALMIKRASGCIAFARQYGRVIANRATDNAVALNSFLGTVPSGLIRAICERGSGRYVRILASFNRRLSKLAHQSAS
jgi:hypothetical protein